MRSLYSIIATPDNSHFMEQRKWFELSSDFYEKEKGSKTVTVRVFDYTVYSAYK